jgi:site-specific recombinase XerD
VARTEQTIADAIPANTRRAYEGDLRTFAEWCNATGLVAMPAMPQTLALFMRARADEGRKYATIVRAVAAICTAHTRAGHPSPWAHPVVADMRDALARELGTRPKRKRAADDDVLRRLIAVIPKTSLLGKRDRALLLLAWCGALRRSEDVAIDVIDLVSAPKGRVLTIGKSKTDQHQHGEDIPVFFSNDPELCPVRALDEWLAASGITEGPIFRQLGRRQVLGERLGAASVRDRVQHWARVAGLAETEFAAHSLRRGFMTTAARRGKDLDAIMRTSRHRSVQVARAYIEVATVHERGAGEGLL